MSTYKVFLGAPSKADLQKYPSSYQWQIVSSKPRITIPATQSLVLPPATLEAASARISRMYENIIFDDSAEDVDMDDSNGCDGEQTRLDQTTMITWPPTPAGDASRMNKTGLSFLDISKSHLQATAQFGTQETQETQSYDYSDMSSIARFPTFHFTLHALTSMSELGRQRFKGTKKITLLLAVLEVEGPDTIHIKKGADKGKEVSLLKMILGDEDGTVCKLTAWREVAESWGGTGKTVAAKRGDILLLENVMAACDPSTAPTLTASPYLKSEMTICYRTMPYTHEDNRLRPDLRLGESDASVRKVAAVVRWFQGMAGLPVTS